MKIFLKTSLIVVIFSLAVVACQTSPSPTVTQPTLKPATDLPVEQPKEQDKPLDTAVTEPTAKPPELPAVVESKAEIDTVECDPGFYLSFDPDVWQKVEGSPGQCLKLKGEDTCIVHHQWGHGMDPEQFDVISADQKIGNTSFKISRYWRRSNGENILYNYVWDNWNHNVSAENSKVLELSDNCLDQFDELMRLSEAKGFKP